MFHPCFCIIFLALDRLHRSALLLCLDFRSTLRICFLLPRRNECTSSSSNSYETNWLSIYSTRLLSCTAISQCLMPFPILFYLHTYDWVLSHLSTYNERAMMMEIAASLHCKHRQWTRHCLGCYVSSQFAWLLDCQFVFLDEYELGTELHLQPAYAIAHRSFKTSDIKPVHLSICFTRKHTQLPTPATKL